MNIGETEYVYRPGDMTPIKCYRYEPFTFIYEGPAFSQKDPMAPGYLLPANCTFVEPPARPGFARKAVYDVKTATWNIVPDYSNIPVYAKIGRRVISPPFGIELHPDLVTVEPPFEQGKWPVWRGDGWVLIEDLSGQDWYDENGNEGTVENPWDSLPEGAVLGVSPRRLLVDATAKQRELLAESKDVQSMLQDVVDGIMDTPDDVEDYEFKPSEASLKNLKNYKVYRINLLKVDLTANPVSWPSAPTLVEG